MLTILEIRKIPDHNFPKRKDPSLMSLASPVFRPVRLKQFVEKTQDALLGGWTIRIMPLHVDMEPIEYTRCVEEEQDRDVSEAEGTWSFESAKVFTIELLEMGIPTCGN